MKIRVKRPQIKKNRGPFELWDQKYEPPSGELHISHPVGNAYSKVLVLAPVPTQQEYVCGTFNDAPARIFKQMLKDEIGLNLEDCLIAPCVRYGEKALKANTRDVMEWVQTCVEKKMFKLVICIGSDAAKWIVNGGKKANIGALAGQMMYPRELNHTPLFLFPDIAGLVWEPHPDKREAYFREQAAIGHRNRLARIAHNLAIHLKEMFKQV